jgi:hypothetical protein
MADSIARMLVVLSVALASEACGGAAAGIPGNESLSENGGKGGSPGGSGGSGGHGGSGGLVGPGGSGGTESPGGAGGCLTAETTVLSPLCREDGWCWIDPFPQGFQLDDMTGAAAGDLWFVGERGTVLRYREGRFALEPVPTSSRLTSVAVDAAGGVWSAGGAGTGLLHRDGETGWREVDPGIEARFTVVFASPAAGVWLAGADQDGGGVVLRRVNEGWEAVVRDLSSAPAAVWAAGPDDAWISTGGRVRHLTAAGIVPVDGPMAVRSISGTGPRDVWFVASNDEVWHWDGETMVRVEGLGARRIRVAAPDDVWALSWTGEAVGHWTGAAWTILEAPFRPYALWPEGGGRAWIAGGSGAIARWDGQGWVRLDRRLGPLLSLDLDSDGILHAVGADGRVVRIDPVSLQATALLPEPGWALVLGVARTPNDLWVVRNLDGLGADIWRWDGCRWTAADVELGSSGELSAAGGTLFGFTKLLDPETPPDLLRHDGRAATTFPVSGFPTALRALGPDEALIAITSEHEPRAPDGRVLRYRDGTLTPVAEYASKIVEVMEHGDGVRAIAMIPGSDWDLDRWFLLEGRGLLAPLPYPPDGRVDWPKRIGPLFHWRDATWVGIPRLTEDGPSQLLRIGSGESVSVPLYRADRLRVDLAGGLWVAETEGDDGSSLLYLPPQR